MESSVARISFKLLASLREEDQPGTTSDSMIRKKVMMGLKSERWSKHAFLSATVEDGTVKLWGIVDSEAEKEAACVDAEQVANVRAIENNVIVQPTVGGARPLALVEAICGHGASFHPCS